MRTSSTIAKRLSRALRRSRPRYQLGYVIPLSEEMHNSLRRIQLMLLREHGADIAIESNLHITLKQAFEVLDVAPFEQHFDQLLASVRPFRVQAKGFGIFDEGIIYMDVVQTDVLAKLRLQILRELSAMFGVEPNPVEDGRYRFHATVAHSSSAICLERSRNLVRDLDLNFEFNCSELELLLHTGREWVTYKHSRLSRARETLVET